MNTREQLAEIAELIQKADADAESVLDKMTSILDAGAAIAGLLAEIQDRFSLLMAQTTNRAKNL